MNVQLIDSLVEVILNLPSEDQKLFQSKLSAKQIIQSAAVAHKNLTSTAKAQDLTSDERLRLWQEWIDILPKSSVNLSNEALRRENIYDDEI